MISNTHSNLQTTSRQPASVDLDLLRRYESEELLKSQRHPTLPLTIWNYTPQTQFGRKWDEITMMCRGLVTDDTGAIVARPFPKFFNLGEYELVAGHGIPDEPFEVYEKLDGSLIIAFLYANSRVVASRGSFVSSQAAWAREAMSTRYAAPAEKILAGLTYLFEAIYPDNRIVVNYAEREELVLLAVIDTATGEEQRPLPDIGFPRVLSIPHQGGLEHLPQHPNEEGYVIRYKSGLRVKLKTDEYVRLHRLLTHTSPKTIWEAMRDGLLDSLLERVPDEFYQWVKSVQTRIAEQYDDTLHEVDAAHLDLDPSAPRKDTAISIQEKLPPPLRPIAFMMLDGRDYRPYVWKLVRPEHDDADMAYRPVKEDEA